MTVTLRRGPRLSAPEVPTGRIVHAAAAGDQAVPTGSSGLLMNLLPGAGQHRLDRVRGRVDSPGPKGYLAAGMFLIASLGFVGVNGWRQSQQHKTEVLEYRREYLAYLAEVRDTVRTAAARQRRNACWVFPEPQPRRARRGADPGLGASAPRTRLPAGPRRPVQPAAVHRPRAARHPADGPARPGRGVGRAPAAVSTHRVQPDLPTSVSACGVLADRDHRRRRGTGPVAGPGDGARAAAHARTRPAADRAWWRQPGRAASWEWVKWLPHTHSGRSATGSAPPA